MHEWAINPQLPVCKHFTYIYNRNYVINNGEVEINK